MGQDILITPYRDSTSSGAKIEFTGLNSGASAITLRVLGDSTLSYEGTAGQLFSISNGLSSGTIFSVNDISGIPSIDVNSSGLVRLAPFTGLVTTNTMYVQSNPQSGTQNMMEWRNLSGTALASVNTSGVFTGFLASGIVLSGNIASGQIGTDHLANGAVTSGDIASGQVGGAHIAASTVANANLVNSSVTVTAGTGLGGGGAVALGAAVTLTNAGVTSLTGGTGITASASTGAITVSIANGAITNALIGSGAITSGNIASGQVGNFHIASGAVTSGEIGNAAVISGNIASGQIGTFHLASGVGGGGASVTISDDTSTNATRYVNFTSATTGSLTTINTSSTNLTFNPSNGNFTAGGNVTANSDVKIKKNIQTISNALQKVLSLRGVEFERIENNEKNIGLIAQEVEMVLPELVSQTHGIKSVAYGNIVAVLIEAIKEQESHIQQIKEILSKLER